MILRNLGESKISKDENVPNKTTAWNVCAADADLSILVDLKQNSAKKLSVRADFLNPVRTNGQQGTDFSGLAIVQNYLT